MLFWQKKKKLKTYYGSKVWHSTDKYRRVIMQCNSKFKNKKRCSTPHFDEESLKKIFIEVFNVSLENREEVLETLSMIAEELTDTAALDTRIEQQKNALQTAGIILKDCVGENRHRALNQDEYEKHYKRLVDDYERINQKVSELEKSEALQIAKRKEILAILRTLNENNSALTEFDESLFHSLVDTITVKTDNELVFKFKDGSEITWNSK